MWRALDGNRSVIYNNESLAVVIWAGVDPFGTARFLEFTAQRPLTHCENLLLDTFEYSPYRTAPSPNHPSGTLEIAL